MYNAGVTLNTDSDIVIISEPISTQRLAEMAVERFGDMVKAVVDTNRRRLALGGELQSDEEAALLELGFSASRPVGYKHLSGEAEIGMGRV